MFFLLRTSRARMLLGSVDALRIASKTRSNAAMSTYDMYFGQEQLPPLCSLAVSTIDCQGCLLSLGGAPNMVSQVQGVCAPDGTTGQQSILLLQRQKAPGMQQSFVTS